MRRAGWPVLVVILVFYGLALARIEALYGQAALRPFVGDIEGEVYLYALNTSVSAALLLTAGVLWGAVLALPAAGGHRRTSTFALSQIAVLGGLAFDDRFLLHERAGGFLGIDDSILLLAAGVVELALLWAFRDIALPDRASRVLLLGAGALTLAMLVVDGALPADLPLRLAAEEVTKVWGAALLAAWAWTRLGAMAVAPLPSEPSVNEG